MHLGAHFLAQPGDLRAHVVDAEARHDISEQPICDEHALAGERASQIAHSAASRMARHSTAISSLSVAMAPIDTRTIQRPSITAGVR